MQTHVHRLRNQMHSNLVHTCHLELLATSVIGFKVVLPEFNIVYRTERGQLTAYSDLGDVESS